MVNYILEMVNFKSWINDEIRGAITKESSTVKIQVTVSAVVCQRNIFNIQCAQLIAYQFKSNLKADLAPIDSALGAVELNVKKYFFTLAVFLIIERSDE